ncbi:MAG TPA: Fic family protein, partial [Chloroflexota bacterium]|nr:Fic family protein [Chloroflexota bacterium]
MTEEQVLHARSLDQRGRLSRAEIYDRLQEGLAQLQRIGGLPSPIEAEDIWGDIWYAEAHNSTAIEGNTLVLKEVEILLRDGRAVGSKQLADYLEVRGYADAARWVYSQALAPSWTGGELITLSEVRRVHQLIMTPVWEVQPPAQALPEEQPGSFRRHDIAPFPGGMAPPAWTDLDATMRDWVNTLCNGPDADQPFPEVLAYWFAWFERIHPFLDGNGRAGRLLMNLALIRLGYPPAIIYKRQRAKYLDTLRKADAGTRGPLGEFLARAILDTL